MAKIELGRNPGGGSCISSFQEQEAREATEGGMSLPKTDRVLATKARMDPSFQEKLAKDLEEREKNKDAPKFGSDIC